MNRKWLQRSIIAAPPAALLLLIAVAIRSARPAAVADPLARAVEDASRLAGAQNDEIVGDWLRALVLSGRSQAAVEFAGRVRSGPDQIRAYVVIADAQRELCLYDEERKTLEAALARARRIRPTDVRGFALALLSARTGGADEAFGEAERITDEGVRTDALSDLCLAFIQSGNFDAAARAAREAPHPWARSRLLLKISEALLDGGQVERGKEFARQALELASAREGGGDRDLLVSSAPLFCRAGLAQELLDALREMGRRDLYVSDEAFEAVAVSLAESGDTGRALAVARGITNATNDGRARALAAVSEAMRRRGQARDADEALTEALKTAQEIEFPAHRSWALYDIAPTLVRAGRADEALTSVRDLHPGDNEPLARVAVALAESGRWDEAERAAAESFGSACSFENTIIRSGVLLSLVRAELKAGRAEEAARLVEAASQKLGAIKDPLFKSDSCGLVAEGFADVHQWERAVVTAETCEQEIDRLSAYTAIVREHTAAQRRSESQATAVNHSH